MPDATTNGDEQAFLLIQGADENGKIFTGKYEFTVKQDNSSVINKTERWQDPQPRQTSAKTQTALTDAEFEDILWKTTPLDTHDDLKYDATGWFKKSFSITKSQAKQIIADINKDKDNKGNTLYYSPTPADEESLRNCYNSFTWCEKKLNNLGDKRIMEQGTNFVFYDNVYGTSEKLTAQTGNYYSHDYKGMARVGIGCISLLALVGSAARMALKAYSGVKFLKSPNTLILLSSCIAFYATIGKDLLPNMLSINITVVSGSGPRQGHGV